MPDGTFAKDNKEAAWGRRCRMIAEEDVPGGLMDSHAFAEMTETCICVGNRPKKLYAMMNPLASKTGIS